MALTDNLLIYLGFTEGSGTSVADYSERGHNAVIEDDAGSGHTGQWLTIGDRVVWEKSADQAVRWRVPHHTDFNYGRGPLSIAFYGSIDSGANTGQWATAVDKRVAPSGWSISFNGWEDILYISSPYDSITASNFLGSLDTLKQVLFTSDDNSIEGAMARLYVDGVEVTSVPISSGTLETTKDLGCPRAQELSEPLIQGIIRNAGLGMWDRVLTEAERDQWFYDPDSIVALSDPTPHGSSQVSVLSNITGEGYKSDLILSNTLKVTAAEAAVAIGQIKLGGSFVSKPTMIKKADIFNLIQKYKQGKW